MATPCHRKLLTSFIYHSNYDPITINIENKSILPHLKKILAALDGVSIVPVPKHHYGGTLTEAMREVKAGKTKKFDSVEDLFKDLGI